MYAMVHVHDTGLSMRPLMHIALSYYPERTVSYIDRKMLNLIVSVPFSNVSWKIHIFGGSGLIIYLVAIRFHTL